MNHYILEAFSFLCSVVLVNLVWLVHQDALRDELVVLRVRLGMGRLEFRHSYYSFMRVEGIAVLDSACLVSGLRSTRPLNMGDMVIILLVLDSLHPVCPLDRILVEFPREERLLPKSIDNLFIPSRRPLVVLLVLELNINPVLMVRTLSLTRWSPDIVRDSLIFKLLSIFNRAPLGLELELGCIFGAQLQLMVVPAFLLLVLYPLFFEEFFEILVFLKLPMVWISFLLIELNNHLLKLEWSVVAMDLGVDGLLLILVIDHGVVLQGVTILMVREIPCTLNCNAKFSFLVWSGLRSALASKVLLATWGQSSVDCFALSF